MKKNKIIYVIGIYIAMCIMMTPTIVEAKGTASGGMSVYGTGGYINGDEYRSGRFYGSVSGSGYDQYYKMTGATSNGACSVSLNSTAGTFKVYDPGELQINMSFSPFLPPNIHITLPTLYKPVNGDCGKWDTKSPSCSSNVNLNKINSSAEMYCNDTGGSGCEKGKITVSSACQQGFEGTLTRSTGVWDRAGNHGTCRYQQKCDKKAPTNCKAQVKYNWNLTEAYVTAYGCNDDNFSNCTSRTVYDNGGVSLTCSDKYGNKSYPWVDVTQLDKVAPNCGSWDISNPPSGKYGNTDAPASVGCSDPSPSSGCAQSRFSGWLGSGIEIKDNAGHTTWCSNSLDRIDKSGPVTSVAFGSGYTNNNINQQTSDSVIPVTVSAYDRGGAGVDRVCYSLSGATNQGEKCVNGSSTTFNIKNDGQTKITAWSFDKAYSYNNGWKYSGGNRSGYVSKTAYIDRTKPDVSVTSDYIKDVWAKDPPAVNINGDDGTNYSGIGSFEWYWSVEKDGTFASDTVVWGGTDVNKPYNTSNVPTGSYPFDPTKVIGEDRENLKQTNSTSQQNTIVVNNPTSLLFNDKIYVHARVCDNAYSTNKTKQPNCTTETYGPISFDNVAPNTNSKITTLKEGIAFDSSDWASEIIFNLMARESTQSGKLHSGMERVEVYFDTNAPHASTNLMQNAIYPTKPYATKYDCDGLNSCLFEVDMLGFSDISVDGKKLWVPKNRADKSKALLEGTRYIRVFAYDVAGNKSEAFDFGPYRWDITRPSITSINFLGNSDTFVEKFEKE